MLILLGIIIYRMSISEGVEESVTVMHRQTILLLQKPTLRSREVLDVLSLLAIPILCYQTLRVRGKCCGSIRALGKLTRSNRDAAKRYFQSGVTVFVLT